MMEFDSTNVIGIKKKAFTFFQNNQLQEAKSVCLQLCQLDHADAEAWHLLGVINDSLGDIDGAEKAFRNTIAHNPQYVPAHCDLGNTLSRKGRSEEALACYREALRLDSKSVVTFNNMGTLLYKLNRLDEAAASYESALRLKPNATLYLGLGNVLVRQQKLDEAAAMYESALRLQPNATLYLSFGNVLVRQQKLDEAAAMYRECLKLEPGNSFAQHKLAACSGEGVPERASDSYIRQNFDRCAEAFDSNLSAIGYKAPEVVNEMIREVLGPPLGNLDILDAGCGTGLCASGLRPYAQQLVGVDLSTGMLEKAAERHLYDQLIASELTDFLLCDSHTYDLIVSTDVLIYFGVLDKLIAGLANSLRENGLLIASVERADPRKDSPDFRLNPHGRYSHTEEYMHRIFVDAGFMIVGIREIVLRLEEKKPVAGLILVGRIIPSPTRSHSRY